MRKQDLYKKAATAALAGAMMAGFVMPAFATGWQEDERGWRYSTNDSNTAWHAGGWQWIDGDNDGTAECYYFGADGYMLSGATTPGGYTVNADGAWVENGAVQVQAAASPAGHNAAPAQAGWYHDGTGWRYRRIDGLEGRNIWVWSDRDNDGTSELYYFQKKEFGGYLLEGGVSPDGYTVSAEGARMVNGAVLTRPAAPAYAPANTYNSQGVSNIALEMVGNTREENAKFGEVEIIAENDRHTLITYANGFCMDYMTNERDTLHPASDPDRKLLFKYYDSSLTSAEAIESYLHGLGVGFKGGTGGTYAFMTGCRMELEDGHHMFWSKDGDIYMNGPDKW